MIVGSRFAAIGLVALVALTRSAEAQSIVLAGRVAGPDGQPLADASVSVSAMDDLASSVGQTSSDGRYRVEARRRSAVFLVAARKDGYATQTRQVAGNDTDSIITVADFRLVRSAQSLAAVRVVAPRPPPSRDQGRLFGMPGESEHRLNASSAFASVLTGDASGDLELALAGIPGIAVTPGPGGTASFTIAGLDAAQNRVTLNGADVGPVATRDGGLLRISTSGYDPTEAMSGVRTEWMILGANYVPNRRLRLTFDAPGMRATGRVASALGQRAAAPILSGVFAGPLAGVVRFQNTSFQISRQASPIATLASLDAAALSALGVSPDSARLLVGALDELGIGALASARGASERVTTSAMLTSRLDLTRESVGQIQSMPDGRVGWTSGSDEGHVLYLIVSGHGSESRGGAGALTLPAYASTARTHGYSVQAFNSLYARPHILNDTRLSLAVGVSRVEPDSPLPAAAVLTSAAGMPDGTLATLQAAGSGGATSTTRNWSVQARNETRWTSVGGRHEWKLALESLIDDVSARRAPSRGRYEFGSVADFLANRPSAFSRSIAGTATDVRGVHLGVGIGDVYTPSRALAWQYGVRIEGHGAEADAARNRLVDSLFGVRTARLPMRFSVAPMAGFTWRYRNQPNGHPSSHHQISGGIRDYRGALPTRSAQAVFGETGLAGGMRELRCIDAAAPLPQWERYTMPDAIPTRCAGAGDGAGFAESALPVSFYSPAFTLGHSVRAEARWLSRISNSMHVSVHGMMAVNTSQPSTVDLNFDGVPRFALVEEGNRPVYASAENLSTASGLTTALESRRYPQFARVSERRSDLRSRSSSLTGTLNVYPVMTRFGSGIKVPLTVSYTLFDTRRQATGYTATTAGDPRAVAWESAASSRHAVLFAALVHVPDWFQLHTGLQVRSGTRYTPSVQGDVNADGLSNDRAFVFEPGATSDAELRTGISALLDGAPPNAARCLGTQLGRIAAANSCTGPWTATLNTNVIVDPARVRLQNRGALLLRVTNILAGVDQLLHGGDRLRGWGQQAPPDPVLLQVRGFDPVARRYRYVVNRSFGDTRVYRNPLQSPFRVAIEIALDVGPDRERMTRNSVLACGSTMAWRPCSGPAASQRTARPDSATLAFHLRRGHDPRTLFEPVIRRADEFDLSASQIDSLEVLGRAHFRFRDSTYDALAGYVAAHGGRLDDEGVARQWRESVKAVARFEWRTGALVRALLTPTQAEGIFGRTGPLSVRPIILEERELERMLKLWQQRMY